MPSFVFKNKKTNEVFTKLMSFKDIDGYLKENPDLVQQLTAPGIADPHSMGRIKPDDSFRDVLKEIKGKHRGSTINTY